MARRPHSDSDPPSPRGADEHRSRLEGVIPDLLKKAVQGGYDRASGSAESIRSFITESKLPKEIAHQLLAQIDDTKNDLFRVVAKEVRGFLEAVDFQRELQKLLTTVSFEIKTEIRFIPNDSQPDKLGRPDVKSDLRVKRNDRSEGRRSKRAERTPPPPPASAPPDDPVDDPVDDPLDPPTPEGEVS
ncbi:MAG: hypothetical protein ACHREM_26635 [Polyangiales bacterium]